MLEDRVNRAFEKIYASYLRRVPTQRDEDRHPEHTGWLLEVLGRPDRAAHNIVVTGSKGKGSTATFIAQFLALKGGPIGLFTSPHLLDWFERIRIDGHMITAHEFLARFEELEPHLDHIVSQLLPGQYVGPNGIFAVIAALHFRAHGVRWAVYETGRGALFDDVTQIHHAVSAITVVLAEHVAELGPTLQDIARHKAGVIAPETVVAVLGSDDQILRQAVQQRVKSVGSRTEVVNAVETVRVENVELTPTGTRFDVRWCDGRRWPALHLPALGPLVQNVATALTVAERVAGPLPEDGVRRIVSRLHWPGRGEVFSLQPYVLVDAAVRPESLAPLLTQLPPFDIAVLSIPDSKDRAGVRDLVHEHVTALILTSTSNPRLLYHFSDRDAGEKARVVTEVHEALSLAMGMASPSSRLLFAGTISFIADVYRYFGRRVE
ncbi:MAG: hypothetical protein OWU33_08280 [Firmicutes bacterium]|nr:hypothetical protein [Bacillota bacterium]